MKITSLIRSTLLTASMVFISLFSLAAANTTYYLGRTSIKMTSEAGKKSLTLHIDQIGSEKVNFIIFDANGNTLKEETIGGVTEFTKRYDLSRLPEGDYSFSLSKMLMEKVQPFTVTNTELFFDESKAVDKFSPMITHTGERIDINLLLTNAGKVKVYFLNESGDQVFADTIDSDKAFNRRYNIAALAPALYTIEIRTKGEVFYKEFEVK